MLIRIKRTSAAFAVLVSLLFVGSVLTPGVAHADYEYNMSMSALSGQPGEAIGFSGTNGHCPSGNLSDVEAVLTDSAQNVWVSKIATTNQNGYWIPSVMIINPNAAYGTARVDVRCKDPLGITSYPYGYLDTFQVTQQSTKVQVDRAQIGMVSTFSSVTGQGCTPNEYVAVALYGTTVNDTDYNWSVGLKPLVETGGYSDSNGEWAFGLSLSGANFTPNKTYYARANCVETGTPYASFAFAPRRNAYVAMGDSYSSGEGTFEYYVAGGACHRSSNSYPYYLTDNVSLVTAPDFQACSGAVTSDFYFPNPNRPGELAQLEPINGYTETVTLTIGGNDIGFSAIAKECANYTGHSGYSCGTSGKTNEASDRIAALDGVDTTPGDGQMILTPEGRPIFSIKTILSSIATAAPGAKIYIAGYPQLFGENSAYYDEYDGNAPGTYLCHAGMVKYSLGDAMVMNNIGESLNQVISDAVDELNDPDIEYVSPSNFNGHGLCDSGTSWLNDIGMDSTFHLQSESLHPTATGYHQGYGAAFAYKMTN